MPLLLFNFEWLASVHCDLETHLALWDCPLFAHVSLFLAGLGLIATVGLTADSRLACRVRELGFLSIMISGDSDLQRVKHISPKAVILSGGPNSVHEGTSPGLPAGFFDYTDSASIPVLGICYGMQLIAHTLGGTVKTSPTGGEFGRMAIKQEASTVLYADEPSDTQQVWMSHGDDVVHLPSGFVCAAKSLQDVTVAIEDPKRHIFGLQVSSSYSCTTTAAVISAKGIASSPGLA